MINDTDGGRSAAHEGGTLVVRHNLLVCVVGSLAVRRAHVVLAGTELGSRKARLLLALLAVERVHVVPIDRVIDVLWGDAPPRQPGQNIATLVSRLRAAIEADTVMGGRAGYRLGSHVRVDLDDAAALTAQAEATPVLNVAISAAQRALKLLEWRGILDDRPDAKWAEPARALHITLVRRARHAAAEAALRLGYLQTAQDTAEAAATTDPFDETACRLLMRAHQAVGEPARALTAYERLRTTLATELGIDPAPMTRDLHLAILKGERHQPGTHAV